MSVTINRCAPNLPLELSSAASAQVAETLRCGVPSPHACPSNAAIRRETCERDEQSPLRPAFVRDAEKIVHIPAYNRLSGKTQGSRPDLWCKRSHGSNPGIAKVPIAGTSRMLPLRWESVN